MKAYPFEPKHLIFLPTFQEVGWQNIMPVFENYLKTDFCFPICIKIDQEVVGIGCMIQHHNTAWLAHIIVHQDYRKKGIGQLLTQTLVDNSYAKGCDSIQLIATDMGAPVYEKIGFVTDTEYLFFKGLKAKFKLTIDYNIVDYQPKYKSQLQLLDLKISAEDRFSHLEQHLANGKIYVANNHIFGYYLPTFGDGLVVGTNPIAGLALINLYLQTNDNLIFPKDNLLLANILHGQDYQEFRTAKRMWLGAKRDWKASCIYNRIGGNLG